MGPDSARGAGWEPGPLPREGCTTLSEDVVFSPLVQQRLYTGPGLTDAGVAGPKQEGKAPAVILFPQRLLLSIA